MFRQAVQRGFSGVIQQPHQQVRDAEARPGEISGEGAVNLASAREQPRSIKGKADLSQFQENVQITVVSSGDVVQLASGIGPVASISIPHQWTLRSVG